MECGNLVRPATAVKDNQKYSHYIALIESNNNETEFPFFASSVTFSVGKHLKAKIPDYRLVSFTFANTS
jgi:hypothetical protein